MSLKSNLHLALTHVYFLSFSTYFVMKQRGVLAHEHRPQGGCILRHDCPAKGDKLLKVIKVDLNASGSCVGEELHLKGDWCDLCLQPSWDYMGTTSVVRFTCLNEKCCLHGKGFPINLCSSCDKDGMVKCPYSGPYWQSEYPGDHKFERI